jgi:hypothetical protein
MRLNWLAEGPAAEEGGQQHPPPLTRAAPPTAALFFVPLVASFLFLFPNTQIYNHGSQPEARQNTTARTSIATAQPRHVTSCK